MPNATATIEHNAAGEAIRHNCPTCQGAIAAEHVEYGPWRLTVIGGRACRQRKVTIHCDFCEKSVATVERRFI